MTRESKLGLLIGGALILLVCILVSDLVATSTNQTPAQLAHQLADDALTQIKNATDPAAMALDGETRRPMTRNTPVYQEGDWPPVPDRSQTQNTSPSNTHEPLVLGHSQIAEQTRTSRTTDSQQSRRDSANRQLNIGDAPANSIDHLAGFNNPVLPPRQVQLQAREAADLKTVTVKKGETLSSLALKHLGSSKRWRELMAANPKQLKSDPRRLQAGMTITIPALPPARSAEATNSTSRNTPRSDSEIRNTRANNSTARNAPVRGPKVVVLKSGETLADVARRELGSAGKWSKLYKVNRSTIGDNPDMVQPGTKLIIPQD